MTESTEYYSHPFRGRSIKICGFEGFQYFLEKIIQICENRQIKRQKGFSTNLPFDDESIARILEKARKIFNDEEVFDLLHLLEIREDCGAPKRNEFFRLQDDSMYLTVPEFTQLKDVYDSCGIIINREQEDILKPLIEEEFPTLTDTIKRTLFFKPDEKTFYISLIDIVNKLFLLSENQGDMIKISQNLYEKGELDLLIGNGIRCKLYITFPSLPLEVSKELVKYDSGIIFGPSITNTIPNIHGNELLQLFIQQNIQKIEGVINTAHMDDSSNQENITLRYGDFPIQVRFRVIDLSIKNIRAVRTFSDNFFKQFSE